MSTYTKPLEGFKRLWAFVYMILALATNLLYIAYIIIPNLMDKSIAATDYIQWLIINFWLIIITAILWFAKFILIFLAKQETKVAP